MSDEKDFDKVKTADSHVDEKARDLEEKISRLESGPFLFIGRAIGRVIFFIILVAIILFDAIIFQIMNNWSGPLAIAALEGLALVILGRTMGVAEIIIFVELSRDYLENTKFLGRNKR